MPEIIDKSWDIAEAEFPTTGTAAQKLRFCLNYAVLAPSGRNAQPWLFNITGDTVELYADRDRALPLVDPGDRELIMSCGTALLHLRLALRHFGYAGTVELFPQFDNEDLLARIALGGRVQETPQERTLFDMIQRRGTNRLPFDDVPVPDHVLHGLQAMAQEEGAWLHPVNSEDARLLVADLIEAGDRIQWATKQVRYQLAKWIHPPGVMSSDGIPGNAYESNDPLSYLEPQVIRQVNLGAEQAVQHRQHALTSPVLAVLGTEADTARDWLAAGQALEKVLLGACAAGVSASFFNQPLQVSALRPLLHDVLSRTLGLNGFSQLIFRMGYGSAEQHTPRRTVDEVLL